MDEFVNIITGEEPKTLPTKPIVVDGKIITNPKLTDLMPLGWRKKGKVPAAPAVEVIQSVKWSQDESAPENAVAVLTTKLEAEIAAEQAAYDQAVAEQDAAAKAKHDEWISRVNAAFDPKQAEIIIELSTRLGL
jgi:butyrate kinase